MPWSGAVVEQEVDRIDVGRQARLAAGQDVAFGAGRNVDDGEDLAPRQRRLRLGERRRPRGDPQRLVRVEGLDELPAQLGRSRSSTTAIGMARTSWPR